MRFREAFRGPIVLWPGEYVDSRGTEPIQISNDGATLKTHIRGIAFEGSDFDGLAPATQIVDAEDSPFTFAQDFDLADCQFRVAMPLSVASADGEETGTLTVEIQLGPPTAWGGIDHVGLKMELQLAAGTYRYADTSGWFEDALGGLARTLPAGTRLKCCLGCLYSDYSPGGHGLFGDMFCFRNVKEDYLAVASKSAFWPVLARAEGHVQETYVCPEFAPRVPGTGYRG